MKRPGRDPDDCEPWRSRAFFSLDGMPVIEALRASWRDLRKEYQASLSVVDSVPYPLPIYSGRWLISALRSNTFEDAYFPVETKRQELASILGADAIAELPPARIDRMFREVGEESMRHNRERFPLATRLLDPLYPRACVMYNFSVMKPGVRLFPHQGADAGNVRVHLCIIEASRCWLEVCGERQHWRRGEVWAFDDHNVHAAEHHGTRDRVVMIIDLKKSYVRGELRKLCGARSGRARRAG